MKLELLSIRSGRSMAPILGEPDATHADGMLIQMRGESGEVYHFQGSATPGQRVEDMLTLLAEEIRATRRRRPAPKYKVKSLMPKSWGKLRSALLGPLPSPIDPRKVVWSKQAFETGLPVEREPIKLKSKRVKR